MVNDGGGGSGVQSSLGITVDRTILLVESWFPDRKSERVFDVDGLNVSKVSSTA